MFFFFFGDNAVITTECDRLLEKGEIRPVSQIEQEYIMFRKRFGPDVLKSLDGEELINTLFNVMNHDGLPYWLEFKNDEIMDTRQYGSIAGGSSLKYIMYKRKSDGSWMTGNPQKQEVLSLDTAIAKGKAIRDAIVHGAELLAQFPSADINDYIALQQALDSYNDIKISGYGWIHKYYHMLFPKLIDAFHTVGWQRHVLFCYGQKPESMQFYALTGQLMGIMREINNPVCHVMRAMVHLYGSPVNYYRVGTRSGSNGTHMWQIMLNSGYVSIGWPALGNLNEYDTTDNELKDSLKSVMEKYYPNPPQTISREVNEIIRFFKTIKENDIIVAGDGKKTLGVGRITGGYDYREGMEFPHVRSVEWFYVGDTELPDAREGLRTTVYPYKIEDNILKIRELFSQGTPIKPTLYPEVQEKPPSSLDGLMRKIETILERKKQIILYGPPGTGKTYYAEKTAQELIARNVFKKSWKALTQSEKDVIYGNGRTEGYLRICCFHASYGYEDFIEGIKPRVANGQTLFELCDGIFKKLCNDAANAPDKAFYLLIDEINRGDISRIMGELIMLIEAGKRGKKLCLPISGEPFFVPNNVYIIGTMNTADRSISLLDVAIRRRFGFYELMPDYTLLENMHFGALPVGEWLKRLNQGICRHIGKDARNLQIGHAYFMEGGKPITSQARFCQVIAEDILPLIEEYCYGDYERMQKILDTDFVDIKNQTLQYALCEGDFAELISALLKPCPEIRLSEETNDAEDVDAINDTEEEEG